MKPAIAIVALITALVLAPFAWDWRSPMLFLFRSVALAALIAIPIGLMAVQIWLLRSIPTSRRITRALSFVGLAVALFVLCATLATEVRFHWVRHQVLNADEASLEAIGQHLIVGYRDVSEIRRLVERRAVAGMFLTSANVRGKTVSQVRSIVDSLQAIRIKQGLPLLWIATDQEGGIVSRLSPPLPRQPALSKIVEQYRDTAARKKAVAEYAEKQAKGLVSVGVNLNLAPVVDLDHQVVNPSDRFSRIHERAISDDPHTVMKVAEWYCKTLERYRVRCVLKHFPGLGRIWEDTHEGRAVLDTPLEELERTDWAPFRHLMSVTDSFVMLGHATLEKLDAERPVSISPSVISGLIRGDWNYDGVLMTDNLTMSAIYYSRGGIDSGSVQAINAGVDLLLVSWDPDQFYRVAYALMTAYHRGILKRDALLRSDKRLKRAVNTLRESSQESLRALSTSGRGQ